MSGKWSPEQHAKFAETMARRQAEGVRRAGWTPQRRERMAATHAAKFPDSGTAAKLRAALLGDEVARLSAAVEALRAEVAAVAQRPSVAEVRIVEWRPDHRRQADGGRPVRAQRREVGLPRRPKVAA